MRLVTKILITLAVAFALPIFLIGRMTFGTMRAIGEGAGREARRVVVASEQQSLVDFTRSQALELGSRLVVYRNDVTRMHDQFEYERTHPEHTVYGIGADRYPAEATGGLPGYGRIHPDWGSYTDYERLGPGSPWLPRWAVNNALADPDALDRASHDLHDVVRFQPTLERFWRRRADTLDLVWIVLTSGATNVHPPYDYNAIITEEPEVTDLDENQEDYVRLLNPENNPARHVRWLEPYFDEFKRTWMTSVVAPIYEGHTFIGTIGMDILLSTIMNRVLAIDTGKGGYAFLLAPSGLPVAIPPAGMNELVRDGDQREALRMTLRPSAEQRWSEDREQALTRGSLLGSPDPEVAALAKTMIREASGTRRVILGGTVRLAAFARVGTTGFRLGIVVPFDALVAPAGAVTSAIASGTEDAIGDFVRIAALIAALSVLAAFTLHYLTVRPIMTLSRDVSAVRWESLEVPRGITQRNDEIGQLASSVSEMLRQLRGARDDVTAKSAAIASTNADLAAANAELVREVAERRRAEEALSAKKELLAVTLTSIGDGVITTDTEGRVVLINAVAAELTGFSPDEARGRPLPDVLRLFDERSGEVIEDPAARVLASGTIVRLSQGVMLRARSGMERSIADSGAPIRDASGATIGVVLVFRDISARRRLEQEMQRIEKLESVSLLAAGIAHDFNNLLAAILGNVSIARIDAAPGSRTGGCLLEAERATLRARDLTTQLLTFAKGGAPVRKLLALPDVLRDAASFSLRGTRVSCDLEVADDLWPVWADAGQVGQVVQNLVINAEQAMAEGGVVRVRACNRAVVESTGPLAAGRYVEVLVSDEGCGIPDGDLSRIFDPFFTTKAGGSGLGLAVCYSIVQKHGGSIAVRSQPGFGTTFQVLLPAASESIVARDNEQHHIARGHGRVLVMDDDSAVRTMMDEMLTALGYEVHTVSDGEAAVDTYGEALARGVPYELVILDLTVPGAVGGKEAVVGLRAIDPNVRAIVSSGYFNDPVIADYESHGFCAAIAKPYDMQRMAAVLSAVLAGRRVEELG